jgi:hypothetical protein
MNQSIHTLDLLYYFLGEVESVKGHASLDKNFDVTEVEDTAHAFIRFKNGASAIFYATNCHVVTTPAELELVFEKGSLLISDDILYEKIVKEINAVKDENTLDNSVDIMDKFMKLPPFVLRPVFKFIRCLDRHGRVPYDFVKKDPNYASAFITNLGSIHLKSGYHHLSNWGTTSLFVIIGERKMRPFYDEEGNVTMKMVNDIGLTIDERIADGFYYAKSVRLFKKLAENPELLDMRADKEVDY